MTSSTATMVTGRSVALAGMPAGESPFAGKSPHERAAFGLIAALIALKLGFLAWFAWHSRWVMDEFAQGYLGHTVEEGLYRAIDPIKTALPQVLFASLLHGDLSSVEIHHRWRLMTLSAGIGVIVLVALIARRLFASWTAALFAVFVLLSFSNFLENGLVVRNDSFAVLLVVAAFAVALLARQPALAALAPGALAGLAFLCTQKTAYHTAAIGLGMLIVGFAARGFCGAVARGALFAGGFAGPLLLYAFAFGGLHFYGVLRAMFLSPLALTSLLDNYSEGLGRYVLQTLGRNPIAYLVAAGGLGLSLSRWRAASARVRAAAVSTVLIVLLVFSHQQPWPYVFVMALPFLAVWAPLALQLLPAPRRLWGLGALLLLLSISFVRNVQRLSDTSASQFELVREAERQLAPDDRYFDGIGMIPTRHIAGRHPWWWWDFPTLSILRARWDRGDRTEIENILRAQPKLWILNYRLSAFKERLGPTWGAATVRVSEFLLLTGCRVDPGREVSFQNLWEGEYTLFDRDGRAVADPVIVDGIACPGPCRLDLGSHRISSPGSEVRFLLPHDFVATGPLPHEGPVRDLFAGIYDL